MAMPLAAPLSTSLMPTTKADTSVPTTPSGAASSSVCVIDSVVSINTGASLVPVMVMTRLALLVSPSLSVMV